MNVTVAGFEQKGRFHKLVATDKSKWGISDPSAFEVGKTYAVEYSEKDVEWQGKTFKSRTITSASLVASNGQGQAPASHSNGKHSDPVKDAQIAKSVAMNTAAAMVEANSRIIHDLELTKEEAREWLNAIKVSEYENTLKMLTE